MVGGRCPMGGSIAVGRDSMLHGIYGLASPGDCLDHVYFKPGKKSVPYN